MLTKRIIPCLDVTDGRVVKGTHFVDLRDAGDPVQLAQKYDREGADELVFLDITASSDKRKILIDLVRQISEQTFIPFTVGGGINDVTLISELLHAGADKVSINTAAIHNPDLIYEASQQFGTQCIVVAIDAKKSVNRYTIYTHGGRHDTGIDAIEWAKKVVSLGAGELLVTSMDKDGTQSGYDLDLTQAISEAVRVPVIASGGAGTLEDIVDVLEVSQAALLASLLHFGQLTIKEIKQRLFEAQIPVRL